MNSHKRWAKCENIKMMSDMYDKDNHRVLQIGLKMNPSISKIIEKEHYLSE